MQTTFAPVKTLAIAAACGLIVGIVTGCTPAISEADAKTTMEVKGAAGQHVGLVVSPAATPFVIMSDDGTKYAFTVVAQTKVRIDGRDAKLDMIKAGDKAAVAGTDMQGQVVATAIDVESSAAKSP